MIRQIRCSDSRFRTVTFSDGLNIVLAERTQESTRNDSCNGLGKSTLVEIIHFLLGSQTSSAKSLLVPELAGWTFTMDLIVNGRELSISRSIDRPAKVDLDGDIPGGFIKGAISIGDLTALLGFLAFEIDPAEENAPSFRSLIAYFARRGIGAFIDPFEAFPKMKAFPRQLNNSFLLMLDWNLVTAWEALNDRSSVINQLRREAKEGTLLGIEGKLPELEIAKVRLERALKESAEQLSNFKVHPQYREIERETSRLTAQIHEASNQNFQDRRIVSLYENSLAEEHEASPGLLQKMYEEAGLIFSDQVKKQLTEVLEFHKNVAKNRRTYLTQEIERLNRALRNREAEIESLSNERSELMLILKTHGALDEYTALQERHLDLKSQLDDVTRRVDVLKKVELGRSSIEVDKAVLHKRALSSLEEHAAQRERAVTAFDNNVRALYGRPGNLIIKISKNGYEFKVEIDRKGSQGVDFMSVFCYDMTLSQLWSEKTHNPGFLLHDSTIFDGVDGRQQAHALELAASESAAKSFQYICALNLDQLPLADFSDGFDYTQFVAHHLTDASPEGSLLGLRITSQNVESNRE